jgi:hypothetical protein
MLVRKTGWTRIFDNFTLCVVLNESAFLIAIMLELLFWLRYCISIHLHLWPIWLPMAKFIHFLSFSLGPAKGTPRTISEQIGVCVYVCVCVCVCVCVLPNAFMDSSSFAQQQQNQKQTLKQNVFRQCRATANRWQMPCQARLEGHE